MRMMKLLRGNKPCTNAINFADAKSGQWPLQVASEFAEIAMSCVSYSYERPTMEQVVERLTTIETKHLKQNTSMIVPDDERCCMCMVKAKGECVMNPCKHAETCLDCALDVISKGGSNRCPICKTKIVDLFEP
eukprot:TRINITY_DN1084_c0_g1_i5.p1 TRINITY_DN1084_c0_g1~~TRINITY_DN1084_c0_g1_i5.p1  ORF type:complete len:133 (+),score=23.59 TRINITY_DN1084_c0_g1_i5:2-400(+)